MRILAIEDGGFKLDALKKKGRALLVGVFTCDFYIEKLIISHVQIDGLDATSKLIKIAKNQKLHLDLIILGAISFAGFNLIDIMKVYSTLKVPIIVVNSKKPKEGAIERAIWRHFFDWQERLLIIEKTKKPMKLILRKTENIYLQIAGISFIRAAKIIKKLTIFGKQPEPIRIARILAYEISKQK
ncbi:MAG: uncharacterized protein QG670_137 [Thermoproteota archaeon]|nr:uncharacterized protein [Thermoproteota archaeon]